MGSNRKRLTDAGIHRLTGKKTRYEVWDTEPGLGLRIAPSGRKSFVYLYRFEGRPRRMTLGVYPRVSLSDARAEVVKAVKKLEKDIDPGVEKIAARKAYRDAESFAELADEFIRRHAIPNLKSWQDVQRQIEVDAIPAWGKRKAKSIARRDVIDLIDDIMDRGAPVTANRTLALLKQVFKFGVQRDVLEVSPAVLVDRPYKEKERTVVLEEDEIGIFWNGLDNANMTEDVRIALKLCLVTGQRRAEVAGLSHSEINGDWWELPAERSKNGKAHRIFLSPLAKRLIKQASGEEYLFPARKHANSEETAPIIPAALINAISKNRDVLGSKRFTVHDLRRTTATRMAQIKISRFDISRVLNHTAGDVTARYDKYAYDPQKKSALLKWSRRIQWILSGKESGKVVSIK